jgi:hypothetical protein
MPLEAAASMGRSIDRKQQKQIERQRRIRRERAGPPRAKAHFGGSSREQALPAASSQMSLSFPEVEREAIHREVLTQVAEWRQTASISGCCLAFAVFGVLAIRRRGIVAHIQAGTALWPHGDRQAGYLWEPDSPQTREALARGLLPEIHVWTGIPGPPDEFVDFAAGFFPEQFGGWVGPKPPPYLWTTRPLPLGVTYVAERRAIALALRCITELWGIVTANEVFSPTLSERAFIPLPGGMLTILDRENEDLRGAEGSA